LTAGAGPAPAGAAGAAREAAYFQAVEEFFVSRRGDPLFLSNPDWLLVRRWRRSGLPLRVVLRGIADALDSHQNSWSRSRPVRSLAYCEAEVDRARERWERALAGGGPDTASVRERLLAVAAALAGRGDSGAAADRLVARTAGELRARLEGGLRPAEWEEWLQRTEGELADALRAGLGREDRARVEAEIEDGLAPYASRMPSPVIAVIRREALVRVLFESAGLPRLSLIHLS
jgi:hypothetical protein